MNKAPWTDEEVEKLNQQQQDPQRHPYTCGSGRRTDEFHLDGEGVLRATKDGWVCPYCSYRQDWY
jgi:DNA-directed RNA polymerase subunit RPC12/RpoP